MKIYRLTSSFHLHEIIESDVAIEDDYHTLIAVPEGFINPRFINGVWVDQTDDEKKESIALSTYATFRSLEYPSIGDQLDALWKGGDEAAAMLAKVQAVKAKYPKEQA